MLLSNSLLFFAYIIVFGLILVDILKRDIFFSIYFIFLFIYSFFSIITYIYYPEIINLLVKLPVDSSSLSKSIICTILSIISLYFSFFLIYLPINIRKLNILYKRKQQKLFFKFVFLFLILGFIIFLPYRNQLSYKLITIIDNTQTIDIGYKIFTSFFKFLPYLLTLIYISLRQELFVRSNRKLAFFVLLILSLSFLYIAISLGNRTDLLKLFISVAYFEIILKNNINNISINKNIKTFFNRLTVKKKSFYKFLIYFSISSLILLSTYSLTFFRSDNYVFGFLSFRSPIQRFILLNDFTFPFTLLTTIIENNIILPFEVFQSNTSNFLAGINYPYLQEITLNYLNSRDFNVTSASSPGFFSFAEGFLFMGSFGFIYNGLVFGFLIAIYKLISSSKDVQYNQFTSSIMVGLIPQIVRAQSATMAKIIWFYVIPSIILYQLVSGTYIKFWSIKK